MLFALQANDMVAPVLALIALTISTGPAARNGPDIKGVVLDTSGHPVEHATVVVYSAGVKHGYSSFCPTCYADCGKKAQTGHDGSFLLKSVDPDLVFQLLVVHDGYQPAFASKFDSGTAPATRTISLQGRKAKHLPNGTARGIVLEGADTPVGDALVELIGVMTHFSAASKPSEYSQTTYGKVPGVEPFAVSDANGLFEIASDKPVDAFILQIEARGFAPAVQVVSPANGRQKITVRRGAMIRGRLIDHGKPLAGAVIGLIPQNGEAFGHDSYTMSPDAFRQISIGTRPDGVFEFADLPGNVKWTVYGTMGTLADLGATDLVRCSTRADGQLAEVGDLVVKPAHTLRGKVKTRDGSPLPGNLQLRITGSNPWDFQRAPVLPDGTFRFIGLRNDSYRVAAEIKGYSGVNSPEVLVNRDVDGFTLLLTPAHTRPADSAQRIHPRDSAH